MAPRSRTILGVYDKTPLSYLHSLNASLTLSLYLTLYNLCSIESEMDSFSFGLIPVLGSHKTSNEPPGPIWGKEFPNSNYRLLQKDFYFMALADKVLLK
jgi:hypothetical protein